MSGKRRGKATLRWRGSEEVKASHAHQGEPFRSPRKRERIGSSIYNSESAHNLLGTEKVGSSIGVSCRAPRKEGRRGRYALNSDSVSNVGWRALVPSIGCAEPLQLNSDWAKMLVQGSKGNLLY